MNSIELRTSILKQHFKAKAVNTALSLFFYKMPPIISCFNMAFLNFKFPLHEIWHYDHFWVLNKCRIMSARGAIEIISTA